MHDALAESSGQTAYAEATDGTRDFVRRLSLPARGINWGALHPHNAVDIAGACGSGVYAAAAGQVLETKDGWGGGYGNYVDVDHGNGVITRYAHADAVLVKAGQMVAAGDMVARMGNTGNSTGCHVHFEVLGPTATPNPFASQ
ncbi:MAG: M23 family metallopeptidase [Candidatus Pacebacteria bacterium]|nr:M23 family metallopeptidase [Candidatus Paceibacterota bacterium]